MKAFIKKILYLVNILTAILILCAAVFFVSSVVKNYKEIAEVNSKIENEYEIICDKYKKLIVFVLKNKLPENIEYFNSAVSATYGLPPAKRFEVIQTKDISNKRGHEDDASIEIECHDKKCIKIHLDRERLLDKVLQGELLGQQEVITLPVKKTTLLKISMSSFLKSYKSPLMIVLFYLFILYSSQSLFLFIKKLKLTKSYLSLLAITKAGEQQFEQQSYGFKKLFDSLPFVQGMVGEYFTHYIHQLLSRDVSLVAVDIIDILKRIEMFFSYQIIKRELKIKMAQEGHIQLLKLDEEILFVVLLNIVFKSINRSKISSEITINVSQQGDLLNVTVSDVGYEYQPKSDSKIKIYELSEPILESLSQKIGVSTKESRNGELNVTSVKFTVSKSDEVSNIIKLKRYGKEP